jgi:hypothetical protein
VAQVCPLRADCTLNRTPSPRPKRDAKNRPSPHARPIFVKYAAKYASRKGIPNQPVRAGVPAADIRAAGIKQGQLSRFDAATESDPENANAECRESAADPAV